MLSRIQKKMLNFLQFRPSVTNEETVNHDDNEYLYAEKMGIDGAPCEHIFSECKISIVDMFSSTFATNQRD